MGTQTGINIKPGALDHFTITGYPSIVIAGKNFRAITLLLQHTMRSAILRLIIPGR